jgi:autotransporter strand-loop-strand O-heptosyltransferase
MAHIEQRAFCESVKEQFPEFFKNKRVLDIGSLDINGSNRTLFENCDYTGIDVGEGRNVDVVCVGHLFQGPDNYYDTIISTEVFEHDMFYEKTVENVMRMLKPGGLFLFTCAAPGRPEHGTRRQGEDCAPLLIQISEKWADYYKNLIPEDFKKISNFNDMFPNSYFEIKDTDIEIPSDLYFYGFKKVEPKYRQFNEDVFVIDCWPDTKEKEEVLINLIDRVKVFGAPIILCGHYPVNPEIQKKVDYFIFDNDNDILLEKDYDEYQVNSNRWTQMHNCKITNRINFHHDYAIWITMKNAFNLANQLGKKYIHFLEYDNLPDEIQYRQSFMEYVRNHDAVLYEYSEGSTKESIPYSATYIFSIRTDVALKVVDQVNSKEEYFKNRPHGWQLENVFYQTLRKVTDNVIVSRYIANDDELNIFAAWNRNGILKHGARFQTYLAVDINNNLYAHFISGFSEKPADKDYLVEIVYNDKSKFFTIYKGHYQVEELGPYVRNAKVKVYYQGLEMFSETLKENLREFRRKNFLEWTNKSSNRRVNINFVDGPFIEILDDVRLNYKVSFINSKTNVVEYDINLKSNHWAKCSTKYYVDWIVRVEGLDNDFKQDYVFDPKDQRVLISFETKSLGDNLAFIPYVEKLRKEKGCKLICSTFFNDLFSKQYPEIEFVEPGSRVDNIYSLYRLGLFYNNDGSVDTSRHPSNPIKEPLLKVASDILGLEYEELKPKLPSLGKKKKKRVCIAVHSTAQAKYWNNPNGWQEVVDYLNDKGYEVRLLSREEDGFMGNKNPKGVVQQPQSDIKEILKTLQESELFIGISSGLSWLSWAGGTPTVLISGFTDDYLEPKNDVIRIINKNVCNSCWHKHKFDAGDWNWCPEHKGTDRQFECSKVISSKDVINSIIHIVK